MQRTRNFKQKLIASLIVFMITFSNFATLGANLVSYAAEEDINYSAEFVFVENTNQVETNESNEPEVINGETVDEQSNLEPEVTDGNQEEQPEQTENPEVSEQPEQAEPNEQTAPNENGEEQTESSTNEYENQTESMTTENPVESNPPEQTESPEVSEQQEQPEQPEETQQPIVEGLAIQITLGVNDSGYLKSSKIDIKNLENQIFKLRDDIPLGQYIQSVEQNKIKLNQIENGNEVKIYIPIELKEESDIDISTLQSGVELELVTTYIDNEGNEEIITKSVRPIFNVENTVDLKVDGNVEKFIPYVKDGINEALIQLKVEAYAENKPTLPIKDTQVQVTIPQIEGTTINNVVVSAIETSYTNGLSGTDAVFTAENWNYQDGVVTISVNNNEKDGRYLKSNGKDQYIISYVYSNFNNAQDIVLHSSINAKSNVFNATGTNEISNAIEKDYNLSQANSNIVTYQITRRTQEMSKGYLYANANSNNPEYEVEFENIINVNISRPDMINTVEIREKDEYFLDNNQNKYLTTVENAENCYYKNIKLNKQNLLSIIGENGNLEILLEDGTSLIQINKDTEDDGDGNITISFGENKIGKILFKINNPVGEGILNIGTVKIITECSYAKTDLMMFTQLNNEYVAAAQLQEGIVTEMGEAKVQTELIDSVTNATVSLNRNELSTLVKNEDVEINISLNNADPKSNVYKNPVFEITFPEEIENVEITDMNVLYGNNELQISNVETIRNDKNNVVIRLTLNGAQSKYSLGDQERGTTIILKTNISLDMYRASKTTKLVMNYYNEDATNYGISSNWTMTTKPSSKMLNPKQGTYDTELKVVAPDGFVNAQMISGYKNDESIISVNQGRKEATVDTFADSKKAEMKMVLINNTDEEMNNVHILGRTIFSGNKSIVSGEELGTNQDAPMTSKIVSKNNSHDAKIYYSENGEATDDLNLESNGWDANPRNMSKIKSYLIVVDGTVKIGDILVYTYGFEIPEKLTNNLDMTGTFGTYYTGTKTSGIAEPDKVVLTTGDAPVLKVETVSDKDENVAVAGERIKYTVRISNEGKSDAEDVVVNSIIPDGTTYIENGELKPETKELKIEVDEIKAGTVEEVSYEVQINENTPLDANIESNNNVEANGLEKPIYTKAEDMKVDMPELSIVLDQADKGRTVEPEEQLWYSISIANYSDKKIENCNVELVLPDGLEYFDAYIVGFESDGITEKSDGQAIYDSNTRKVTWHLDSIDDAVALKLKTVTSNISESQKELIVSATASSENLTRAYTSNEIRNTLAKPIIESSYTSSIDNKFLKEGDSIRYTLKLKNVGIIEARDMDIENTLPDNLKVVGASIIKDGVTNNALIGKTVNTSVSLEPNQEVEIVLECNAENVNDIDNEVVTANNWKIDGKNIDAIQTKQVQNIIIQNPELTNEQESINKQKETEVKAETKVEKQKVEVNEQNNEKVEQANAQEKQQNFKILGKAFNDFNKNGQRDPLEEGMANIVAKLCSIDTQKIVAQTITNNIGEYMFENVPKGEYYIRFAYDNTKYQLADYKKKGVESNLNSDAIISNYKAVTDKIVIDDNSVSDIDIGLIRAGIFDLSIDANINKITVQDKDETVTHQIENSKLAKIDIKPQKANSSMIYVEYTITISNKGEIAGFAKRIVDYLPKGLELDTSLNPNWYVGADGYAYNQELENEIINPGETKTITLTLTKQMTENGTGVINNDFEIAQTYNEYAIGDIDSTEANKVQGEDDMSRADLIIGIQTGGSMINLMIVSTTLITLLITLYVIKIYVDKKNKEVIV